MIATKLAFVLFCWTAAFALPTAVQVVFMHAAFVLGRFLPLFRPSSAQARRLYVRFLLYAGLLSAVVVILNALFVRNGEVLLDLGIVQFSREGVEFGLRVSVRLVLMSTAVLVFFLSTPLRDLAAFLDSSGAPAVLTSVLLLSLEFLERLPQRIEQIFTAQEARGAPVRAGFAGRFRSLFSILGPLIVSSIVESVERSHALALRGFPAPPEHRIRIRLPLTIPAWSLIAGVVAMVGWKLWESFR